MTHEKTKKQCLSEVVCHTTKKKQKKTRKFILNSEILA